VLTLPVIPPSIAAPLLPSKAAVKVRLSEAMNDVRLLKQLLKVVESAERTVGVDVTTQTPATPSATHDAASR